MTTTVVENHARHLLRRRSLRNGARTGGNAPDLLLRQPTRCPEPGIDVAASAPDSQLIRRADGLADARQMRDAIFLVLRLLEELDDIDAGEPDLSAFEGFADLFDDIADFALCGAEAAMRAASRGDAR